LTTYWSESTIIVMIKWTGLAPWEFEFPFPGSLTSTFLVMCGCTHSGRVGIHQGLSLLSPPPYRGTSVQGSGFRD